jgi:glycosyltransferase involved in cell wall biosynthesis
MADEKQMISILIPNYNSGSHVRECIDSIRAQSFSDWEVVICDSGSTDESRQLLEDFAVDDNRVIFYDVPKEGIYPGWNECLKRACGKYVYIATADDLCSPDLLSSLFAGLEKCPSVDLAYCRLVQLDASGVQDETAWEKQPLARCNPQLFEQSHVRESPSELWRSFFYGHPVISINQLLIRRSLFEKTGPFPVDLGPSGDVLWHLRALSHSDLIYVHGPYAGWRIHEAQASTSDGRTSARQCQICRERFIEQNPDFVSGSLRRGMALARWHLLRRRLNPFQDRVTFPEGLDMLFALWSMGLAFLKKLLGNRNASFTALVAGNATNTKGVRILDQ